MNISIDAGGYCTDGKRHYGNYTFTENLIQALLQYDNINFYSLYSFCPAPLHLKLKNRWRYKLLLPRKLWLKVRVSLEEFISRPDIFLALNQAIPLYTGAKIIGFSHGLSYYYFPQYYRQSFIRLSLQLNPMIQRSKYIIVSSQKVKQEMQIVYPQCKNTLVLPFGVPFDMLDQYRAKQKKPYFLYVGMNHPIKNIKFVQDTFKRFRKLKGMSKYHLILVGPQDMHSHHKEHIQVIPFLPRPELKKLYAEATAYLTASLYESFNIPALEALAQNCPVIGMETAIIPEFKPYVTTVNNENGFFDAMVNAVSNKNTKIDIETLKKTFSWEDYVKKLLELYK